jgi:uncharacterized membrane protein
MLIIWGFWAAIVVIGVVLVLRLVGGSAKPPSAGKVSEAEEILKRRFASGEITKEQYDEMLEHIRR